MPRALMIMPDPERRVLVLGGEPETYCASIDGTVVVLPSFQLFGDDVMVDPAMLTEALPVWEAFVAELGETEARAKVLRYLDLACGGLGLPEKPLADGASLRALNPAGTILYVGIGCSFLAGVTQHP